MVRSVVEREPRVEQDLDEVDRQVEEDLPEVGRVDQRGPELRRGLQHQGDLGAQAAAQELGHLLLHLFAGLESNHKVFGHKDLVARARVASFAGGTFRGFSTRLRTYDAVAVFAPNCRLWNAKISKFTRMETRMVEIKIGIAYGSDTDRAIEVLKRVARANPHILSDPEPQLLFLGFGHSSLDFELRVFSPDVSHLMPIRHQLHLEIDRAFRQEGIEIAFPQRDLHVRSVPEAWRNAPLADARRDEDPAKK